MKGLKLTVAALLVAAFGSLFAPMADAHFRFPRGQFRQDFRQGFRAGLRQGFHR